LSALTALDLSGTRITDAGLVHLKGLPRLSSLTLTATQVTDAGLEHLKGMTGLKTLYLNGTDVTDASVQQFKQSRPSLRVATGEIKVQDWFKAW